MVIVDILCRPRFKQSNYEMEGKQTEESSSSSASVTIRGTGVESVIVTPYVVTIRLANGVQRGKMFNVLVI